MEYIKLNDAIQAARPEGLNENRDDKELALYAKGWNACMHTYVESLCELPAADVRPVVNGEWRRTTKNLSACSACGNCVLTDRTGGYFFCPNCGADMRKGPPKEES